MKEEHGLTLLESEMQEIRNICTEWISVDDRLPDKWEEVLVWAKKIEGEIYYEVDSPSCVKVVFDTIDRSPLVDWDYYEVLAIGITHWMPLPEPPTTSKASNK